MLTAMRVAASRLLGMFRRKRFDHAMDEEFQSHLLMLAERFVNQGMTKDEALHAAKRQFGGVTQMKEELRERSTVAALDAFSRDVRYAFRQMRNAPVFTAAAVLTLALGIGANTALFSVVNAVLLRSLPVTKPDQLVLLKFQAAEGKWPYRSYDGSGHTTAGAIVGSSFPYTTFQQVREHHTGLSDVFAFAAIEQLDVVANGNAEIASGQYVSGRYYAGLGVKPWRGRVLSEADDKAGAPLAAVITWRYWQRRFSGDSAVIGTTVEINNVPFSIVGVTPPGFVGAGQIEDAADITIPLAAEAVLEAPRPQLQQPAAWWLVIMGLLSPGITRQQAQAGLEPVFQQSIAESLKLASAVWKNKPATLSARDYPHLAVAPGSQGESDDREAYRRPLIALIVVVGLVLLIACINVANLLLARGAARQQEIAMRAALGAKRSRLIYQLLTESLLLALIAGAAAWLLAYWGKDMLVAWSPWASAASARDHLQLDKTLDLGVLGFAAALSLLTGILFGLAPALRSSRSMIGTGVSSGRLSSTSRAQSSAGRALVVAQIAVSMLLLMAAGMFIRTLRNLHNVNTGFDSSNLLLFRVKPQVNGYSPTQITRLYERLLDRLGKVPGVRSVALSRQPLLARSQRSNKIFIAGRTKEGESVQMNNVSPSFFETMHIPILLGRSLTDLDTASSPRVAIVNQEFARKYFPDINPIGERFVLTGKSGLPGGEPNWEIVGISRDAKYTDLRSEVHPTLYLSYLQESIAQANFEIRYAGDEASIVPAVRQAVREVDAALPIFELRTQTEQAEASVAQERMFANLSGSMGSLALLLVAIGLYGTMSYAVVRRTQEIGVRMALGAQREVVLAMVLRDSLSILAAGLVIGILLTVVAARASRALLDPLLFGVRPNDPITVAFASCVLLLVALVAGFVPAWRASRVDPMAALRCE